MTVTLASLTSSLANPATSASSPNSASLANSANSATANRSHSTGASESVSRPEPGLARGRWEAPAWAFYVTIAVVVACAMAYAAHALRARRRESR